MTIRCTPTAAGPRVASDTIATVYQRPTIAITRISPSRKDNIVVELRTLRKSAPAHMGHQPFGGAERKRVNDPYAQRALVLYCSLSRLSFLLPRRYYKPPPAINPPGLPISKFKSIVCI